jgi:hypothetical protein
VREKKVPLPLPELMSLIESHRFSAEVNLAAGIRAFRQGVCQHPLFLELRELCKDVKNRGTLAQRIDELSHAQVDARYENRYDAAFATYLMALRESADPNMIAEAALAASKAPKCRWTVTISRELLTQARTLAGAGALSNASQASYPQPPMSSQQVESGFSDASGNETVTYINRRNRPSKGGPNLDRRRHKSRFNQVRFVSNRGNHGRRHAS